MITKACLRDITYVGANMRGHDWAEISCQLPDYVTREQAAAMVFEASPEDCRFVGYDANGVPAVAFGFAKTLCPTLWQAWAFGTPAMRRIVPNVTKYLLDDRLPYMIRTYQPKRLEARAWRGNTLSCRWLEYLGATAECELPRYGRNGETFVLYTWTDHSVWTLRAKWATHQARRRRKEHAHVFCQAAQASEAAAGSATADCA